MLPLLKQGRDAFIVRAVGEYETCKKWDVVLYKRPPESYVLHRVVRVLGNSYDILGDNCIGIERNIPKDAVIGVMTGFIRNGKKYEADSRLYKLYVLFWCKPYRIRILMKKIWFSVSAVFFMPFCFGELFPVHCDFSHAVLTLPVCRVKILAK